MVQEIRKLEVFSYFFRSNDMNAAITLERVTFQHSPDARLVDISVTIPDAAVTAVVGLSGSGKSTLLQLINGMVRPHSGSVSLFGKPIDYERLPHLRRRIGYMAQGPGLFPHLTVEKNIALASRIRKEDPSDERINHLMTRMGLALSYRKRHPYQLSGGEQQRAAICMALYTRPSVLLMDESLGALDVITRTEIQLQLAQLQKAEQCTMIFITHDMQEALRLGDRLLVMHEGHVEAFGTTHEVQSSKSELVQKLFAYSLLTPLPSARS